jgi:hypothetical protein
MSLQYRDPLAAGDMGSGFPPGFLRQAEPGKRPRYRTTLKKSLSSFASTAFAGLMLALSGPLAHAETLDRSMVPIGTIQELAAFQGPGPSGIVVTPEGRTFVDFPRHAIDHPGMTLGELVDGKLLPYPSADISQPSSLGNAQRLISVHGMTLDSQGRLWLIDDGKEAGHKGIAPGAAKVVGIDLHRCDPAPQGHVRRAPAGEPCDLRLRTVRT